MVFMYVSCLLCAVAGGGRVVLRLFSSTQVLVDVVRGPSYGTTGNDGTSEVR